MKISCEYGSLGAGGVLIELTGDEVSLAIIEYLNSQRIGISGPRTVKVNGGLCDSGSVFVDPSGDVTLNGGVVRLVIC